MLEPTKAVNNMLKASSGISAEIAKVQGYINNQGSKPKGFGDKAEEWVRQKADYTIRIANLRRQLNAYDTMGLTSGGLISSGSANISARDSVPAMLEPGEFVLRKAAVNRMGIDTANKLNSTGDVGGDTEVEVNITNNGTPVNVSATPQVRRENGKIVLDIILEDLRNNGPIKQQIRSIR